MTVAEVIAKLSTMNPQLECVILHPEWGEDEPVQEVAVRFQRKPFTDDEVLCVRIES
jgi:hypothetical protein